MRKPDAIVAGAEIRGCTVARRLAVAGRRVHVYGSHIFHTRNEEIRESLNRFTRFNDYRHYVLARYKEKTYHLPIGCTLQKGSFGRDLKPSELNEADREAIFEAFIRGYASKQWGVSPEKVPVSVIDRMKVRDSFSTGCFDDPHQGIPADGCNVMFERMLDYPNIAVECNREFTISL